MHSKRSHVALYGRIAIRREYCRDCHCHGFVLDGRIQCCGKIIDETNIPERYKRLSQPEQARRLPKMSERKAQLEIQDNKCFYCFRTFGTFVFRNSRAIRVNLCWDHALPFALTQNNDATNFVASCQVCNGIKTSLVFRTVEEARIHIQQRRSDKGYL